ncbi:MAG TPA: hypothetical protein VK426_02750 [Methanobacterium sp.]|nr:hypothetical protein [Methanobacterium sp.]
MIKNFLETGLINGTSPNGSNIHPHDMAPAPNGWDIIGISTIIAIIIGIANICLLIALLYVYLKSYRQLKSKFTMGLLVFAGLLLIQNVVSTLFLALNMIIGPGNHSFEIGRPEFPLSSINVIQLVALSILLYITWE